MSETRRFPRGARVLPAALAAAALGLLGRAPAVADDDDPAPGSFAPGRLLVKFQPGSDAAHSRSVLAAHGARVASLLEAIDVLVVELPPQADEHAVARSLRGHAEVEFAEPDALHPAEDVTPDDTYLWKQWHVTKIQAPAAWSATTGDAGVVIAILDTGVDGSHPDLASKLVAGWNFYDGNSNTSDVYGHGTAVAGTAATATDNGLGVAGVAWSCPILPIRVSNPSGSALSSTIAQGLTWAADHGARVANVSYGVTGSSTVASAAKYFRDHGGVVAVSAGNQATFDSSADNPYLLTVGATTSTDALASFSNTGNNVDLVAPGSGVYSTVRGGGYGSWSGTSFSAPIVAGVAALVLSAQPGLSGAEAMAVVRDSADDLGATGWDATFGTGRVNANRAVALALGVDPAPPPAPPPPPAPDTTAPTVSISSPAGGAVVSGNVTVAVSATDDKAVVRVELYVDGTLVATATAAPFTTKWNSRKAASGAHGLQCKAYDAAGNAGTSAAVGVTK